MLCKFASDRSSCISALQRPWQRFFSTNVASGGWRGSAKVGISASYLCHALMAFDSSKNVEASLAMSSYLRE